MIATIIFAAILALLLCLLYLQRKWYRGALTVAEVIQNVAGQPTFTAAVENAISTIRTHFDADLVRLVIQEMAGERAAGWDVSRPNGNGCGKVRVWSPTRTELRALLVLPPTRIQSKLALGRPRSDASLRAAANKKLKSGNQGESSCTDHGFSAPVRNLDGNQATRIEVEVHSPIRGSWSLLAVSFCLNGKWLGRLTIFNPRTGRRARTDANLLSALVTEAAPMVEGKYRAESLRSRVQARERVRVAQNLHDGILQSLIGLEMQIDALRRTQPLVCQRCNQFASLSHLQALFHEEIANLREEMWRIKPLNVRPANLLNFLAGIVERFRRETGIPACFTSQSPEICLHPRVAAELARILQEALVNIRKHSRAQKVLVSFSEENGHYELTVEDDGRGFNFTGRLSSTDFVALATCPMVIKERVDAIGGELIVESVQGAGSRLQILVPVSADSVFSEY